MKVFTIKQAINLAKTLVVDWDKEQTIGIYLNSDNVVVHKQLISLGTLDANLIHPREVFRPAIKYASVGVVLLHNHPSGCVIPSKDDGTYTNQITIAGEFIGIKLIDHIIFTRGSKFYSFNREIDKI
jgi:DNA repair protein RadC